MLKNEVIASRSSPYVVNVFFVLNMRLFIVVAEC